ncbi:cytochrome c [uncultured Ruegeria sp.]|uniref:c-type cytochrome n=1 Tax=uncultured Ruegeria sp. TaxID=259304 RepID=UPI00345B61F8
MRKAILSTCICFGTLPIAEVKADAEVGDVELGAYLSAECVTCHQTNAETDGIPQIVGLDPNAFVDAMLAYKTKQREHPIMQMMAGRLNDEEIAALAAYFNALE